MVSVLCSSASSCNKGDDSINTENNNPDMISNKISIKIGSKTFTATLLDNSAANAFKQILPLTINMAELNGNEKYFDLSKILPTSPSNPGTIRNGDLMLYGSRTLVLFYNSFSTSYSYTNLGRIENIAGLAEALGSGTATVTFE